MSWEAFDLFPGANSRLFSIQIIIHKDHPRFEGEQARRKQKNGEPIPFIYPSRNHRMKSVTLKANQVSLSKTLGEKKELPIFVDRKIMY